MNELEMKLAIQKVIKNLMDNFLGKNLRNDPFVAEDHRREKPLYAALVPDEIFKGSHFERRFTTRFGHVWQQLAVVVAEKRLGIGIKEHKIVGTIPEERLHRISEILNELEHQTLID